MKINVITTMIIISFLIVACGSQTNKSKSKVVSTRIGNEVEVPTLDTALYNQLKDGEKHGLWKTYDSKNELETEGFYKNGKANGLMKWYFDGALMAYGNMEDDLRHGIWKICDVHDPTMCIDASFKRDKRDGYITVFHKNGAVSKKQIWESDKMVSEKCWDAIGQEIACERIKSNEMKEELLITGRLNLRKITPEVIADNYRNLSDSELMEYFGWTTKNRLNQEKEKFNKGLWTHNRQFLYFQLLDSEKDQIIGWCGYHTWYLDHKRAEMGYEIFNEDYRGGGLMSEAIGPVIEYGFKSMGLNRIEAFISPENVASLSLVKRFSFIQEGHLRGHYYKNGHAEDSLVFSLLKSEYGKK